MNDFTVKKSAEVLAFTRVGQQIIKKSDGLETVIEESALKAIKESLSEFESELHNIYAHDHLEAAETKAQKTADKLMVLAETYIGDEWDNPVEVLEWLGFFEGAAIVHCAVVEGAAAKLALADLLTLSTRMKEFHRETLRLVETALGQAGSDNATTS